MYYRSSMNSSLRLALAAVGVISSGLAFAQPPQEITITGERASRVVGRSSTTGAPIEELTLSRKVSYADLDLSSSVGASELEKRINDTAKALCERLDVLSTSSSAPGCVKHAAEPALAEAHAAIVAAQQRLAGAGTRK